MFVSRPLASIVGLVLSLAVAPAAMAQVSFKSGVTLPNGGEIVSFANGTLLATNSVTGTAAYHGVEAYTLTASGSLAFSGSFDLSSVFGGAANIASVSSVLADARGFGVATVIPTATGSASVGRLAFFNMTTGAVLNTLDVGYHPDSVTITPDGSRLLIANEGEFVSTSAENTFARPGSVSVVGLAGISNANDVAGLTAANVQTFDFSAANLAAGVTLTGIRNARLDTLTVKTPDAADIEPEYIAATSDKAFVTLQENNAVAVLDFTTGKYEAIHSLGAITQTIDASDQDGASNGKLISVSSAVRGLPMPDTMVRFSRSGTTYLVTANEGDARPDDGDVGRANTLYATMTSSGSTYFSTAGRGRLTIIKDQGDTDADGLIDSPTMLGTRSFSIWNAATGALAFDSGSMIEQYVAAADPTTFNINSGNLAQWDTRSDDKGPEPEAIAFATIDGRDYVFVGAERQNGIFQFDVTDLANVSIVGYFNPVSSTLDSGGAFISPESMQFLAAGAPTNPTGQDLLIVGFEGTGGNGSVGVFVVPEPSSTWIACGGAGLLAGRAWRRRRGQARPQAA
jgi:hypothetical protein